MGTFEMDVIWVYIFVFLIIVGAIIGGIICCMGDSNDTPDEGEK